MSDGSTEELGRLVDLAVEWLLQYAGESTVAEESAYPGVRDRLGQVEGYLSASALSVVWFGPRPGDRPDPWGEAGGLMARVEAEYSGRLLIGSEDLERFDDEPQGGLTWAVAGLRGVSELLRTEEDRLRLARLLERGVRAFRLSGLVDRPPSSDDDRMLDDPERSALDAISACVGRDAEVGSIPMIDLAGLPPRASGEVISRIEDSKMPMIPIVSIGGSPGGTVGGLRPEDFERLRGLGGVVGLGIGRAFFEDAGALGEAIDRISAEWGLDGVAIGTGFLGVAEPTGGLGNVPELLDWLAGRFGAEDARRLASENARGTIVRSVTGR